MVTEVTATTTTAAPAVVGTSGTKMIVTMGALGLVCAVLIVAAFQSTLPAIERNKAAALERAIFDVIPNATSKTVFAEKDGRLVPAEEAPGGPRYYAGYDDDHRLIGVAVEASGQGFADIVKVIYGYAPAQGAVVGMKVLESHETPGLGTKIETDPAFRANFEALEARLDGSGNGIANPIVLV
ncbi:MAG TPA: FMN-binding protein [Candidatus Krumholzibacteria bacterium]|nr:FMN-binding protein [Candidatus Krumholzibacteria bacterium]